MHAEPLKPTLKAPGSKHMKLKYDKWLSNFASNFTLRRFSEVAPPPDPGVAASDPDEYEVVPPIYESACLSKLEYTRFGHHLEVFTFLRFGFQVFYCLDLERLHVAQDALRPWCLLHPHSLPAHFYRFLLIVCFFVLF